MNVFNILMCYKTIKGKYKSIYTTVKKQTICIVTNEYAALPMSFTVLNEPNKQAARFYIQSP